MNKFNNLIPGIFGKLLQKKTQEEEIDEIATYVKDNYTALKLYKLSLLNYAFDVIEGESIAKFAFEHKHYDNNKFWITAANESINDIKYTIQQMHKIKERTDTEDDDEEEIFIDYSGTAEHFAFLLDKNTMGDEIINDRKARIAKTYFNGQTAQVEQLKKLCEECYIRKLDNQMEEVFWVENEFTDNKLTEMKYIFDDMAEKCIMEYGRERCKIIQFPGTGQEK